MISGNEEGPWIGESGTEYTYYIFNLDIGLPSRMGNFIYAKRNEDNLWVPIYMGCGNLRTLCTEPQRLACIKEKGATHLHARLNTLPEDRERELQDLLARYKNAFPPDGCNILSTRDHEPIKILPKSHVS